MGAAQSEARFRSGASRPWGSPLAACLGESLDLFYSPTDMALTSKALEICGRCPVRLECLAAAEAEEGTRAFRIGVKGGQTPEERRRRARSVYDVGRVRKKPGRPPKSLDVLQDSLIMSE